MQASSGAHYWTRRCREYGLVPRLMAAQFVRPFRKKSLAKNDRKDAEAIATAARQGNMRFVPVKDIDQQARLSWHRVIEGHRAEHLAIGNRLRGLLTEFGIVLPHRDAALHGVLGDLDACAELPGEFKELLRSLAEHWVQVHTAMAACDARTERHARQENRCVRLRAIVGAGPLMADAMVASIGNVREFKNECQLAGGRARLGVIRCRGDLPAHPVDPGTRSSLERTQRVGVNKATPEQVWVRSLVSFPP